MSVNIDTIDDPRFYPIIEAGNYITPSKLIGIANGPQSLVIGSQSGGLTSSAPPYEDDLPVIDCIPATGVSGYSFIEPSNGVLQYKDGLNYTMAPTVNSIGKPSSTQMKLGSNSYDSSVSFGNCTNTSSNSVIMGTGGLLTVNQTSNLPPSVLVKNFDSTNNFLQYSSNVISLSCKSEIGTHSVILPDNTIFIPLSVVIIALEAGSGTIHIQGSPITLTSVPQYYCYVANIPTTVFSGSFSINSHELRVKVVVNGNLLQLD